MPSRAGRPDYDEIDLSPTTFWDSTSAQREAAYSRLRSSRPVSWQRPSEGGMIPPGPEDEGFWAVTGQPEIMEVSRAPDLFSSQLKGFMLDDIPLPYYDVAGSVLFFDPPRHTHLRRLVSTAFTPRHIRQIEQQINGQATAIVDDLLEGPNEVDFMKAVAERLPMWTIAEALGVPPDRRREVADTANEVNSTHDPEIQRGRTPEQVMAEAFAKLGGVGAELAVARRKQPQDDLMTALVRAEVDGEKLTDQEICGFFLLLSTAGNDTTRNATGHAVRLLANNPSQRAQLKDDLDGRLGGAVEEILRHSAPVMTMRRTTTRDVTLGDQQVRAGDKVVLYYHAANFDARVFDNPEEFDITRNPNRHVTFGGNGPHFCLGAPLARAQLKAVLRQLLTRVPNLQIGEPEMELSNFIHAIKRLPCRINP